MRLKAIEILKHYFQALYPDSIMKENAALLLFIFLVASCSPRAYQDLWIRGKIYESKSGPLYKGSRFNFNGDSTFVYTGYGPSVFLSKGIWKYDSLNREIILQSQKAEDKWINPKTVDTLWVNLSNKRIKIITKRKIKLDDITYYLR